MPNAALERAASFCRRFDLEVPILMAPMAGACPASLSIAVAKAGGMGGAGALLWSPDEIRAWAREVRAGSNGAFQMNIWVPDPEPVRDAAHEADVRAFLGAWGPEVAMDAGDAKLQDFAAQCDAMLDAGTPVISSIMGVFEPAFVARMKTRGVAWFATATTVAEAKAAGAAGADVIVAQGAEAGGHRGAFDAAEAERRAVGLFALLPAIADAVDVPVVAAGGIADGRTTAAALTLGASAVTVGTALLRAPEAKTNAAWADALTSTMPEDTMVTRAFSGRAGRSISTDYARAAAAADAPKPAPYPIQRGLTAGMRTAAGNAGDVERMQVWAGQAAAMARAEPAGDIVARLWAEAKALLS